MKSLDDLYYATDENGLSPMDADGGKVQKKIQSVGGWRGLFDPFAHEWNESTLEEKLAAIRALEEMLECKLDTLIWLYFKDNTDEWNQYKLDAIPSAIYNYAEVDREAEEYLLMCRHPLFLWFAQRSFAEISCDLTKFVAADPNLLLVFSS